MAVVTLDEMQRYVVRCDQHLDVKLCVNVIIDSRSNGGTLEPMNTTNRNMSDRMKIIAQTLLFEVSADSNSIALSNYLRALFNYSCTF